MKRPHSVKSFLLGGSAALGGLLSLTVLASEVRTALDELALIRSGEPVDGLVTDSGSRKRSGDYDYWWIEYAYSVDGEPHRGEYEDTTDWRAPDAYARTGAPVDLEYVPGEPSVSRPLGTGAGSLPEWVARRVSAIGLLLVVGSAFVLTGSGIIFFQFYSLPLWRDSRGPLFQSEPEQLRPVEWVAPPEWVAELEASGPGPDGDDRRRREPGVPEGRG